MSAGAAEGIQIRNVAKRYGSTVALDGVALDLRPGEVLGIAGPNGAGKSTLIRIIAGEERPDSGTLTFDGRPWFPSIDWHQVAVVHLNRSGTRGTVKRVLTSADFDVPTTVARFGKSLYLPNARFGNPDPANADFWATRIDKR